MKPEFMQTLQEATPGAAASLAVCRGVGLETRRQGCRRPQYRERLMVLLQRFENHPRLSLSRVAPDLGRRRLTF